MPKANTRAPYIDVTLHQAARRESLSLPTQIDEPMSLKAFLWTLFALVCLIIAVLWYLSP